nr:hypothetical protein [Rhodoferax sp.]
MNINFFSFNTVHHLGESATRPIEPLATRPGSLLRLAGSSLLRCRAYPATPPAAHSGESN